MFHHNDVGTESDVGLITMLQRLLLELATTL